MRPNRSGRTTLRACTLLALFALFAPSAARAAAQSGEFASLLLGLVVILGVAKLFGDLAVRAHQPPVLGELVAGILLGNLNLIGIGWAEWMAADPFIEILAEIGVVLLLFEVGLESTVKEMLRVGAPSFFVALLGVITPFALGIGVGYLALPGHTFPVYAFLGATLTATSVGITARVLQDLNRSRSPEARVILGAAVIDDVMGLVILAAVAGWIEALDTGSHLSIASILAILGKALGFLLAAIVVGQILSPRLFRLASKLRVQGVLLTLALLFCFVLAALSGKIGLAPIVGAYAAGLILEEVHYRELETRSNRSLHDLIAPIAVFLVPIFFVRMGMLVDLASFLNAQSLRLAGLLTLAAILGKQACALGAFGGRFDRLSVGIGMIPRGEVGLIFANIGLGLHIGGERIIDPVIFSAVVLMVIVTTMVTPPALKWSLSRKRRESS
ncbi:MAG: cation:proton antiporter [Candidatus Eisenbacteria bacterium]